MESMRQTLAPDASAERPNWLRRIGWLALIWAGSVTALFVVAMAFKAVMGWVGLTPPVG